MSKQWKDMGYFVRSQANSDLWLKAEIFEYDFDESKYYKLAERWSHFTYDDAMVNLICKSHKNQYESQQTKYNTCFIYKITIYPTC